MRVLRFDDGTRFDDPNAYFGDPSYVLEPGDPGYVIPPPPANGPQPNPRRSMSSNATPKSRVILLPVARNIHSGQVAHGAPVGLLRHLAPAMDAKIKKIEGDPGAALGSAANKGSQLIYRDAIDATGDAEEALGDLSDGDVKTWLDGYRKVMAGIHGPRANAGWEAAGFPQGSTAVPRNHDRRHTLLSAARAYLAAHADCEATLPRGPGLPPLEVTAAAALALETSMQTAKNLVSTRQAEQESAKMTRDDDVEDLYQEVSATIMELGDALADDDPRWEYFGLNIPANPTPPLGVATLTLTSAGTGRELAAWPYAVRAEYYQVYLKRVGIDAEPVLVGSPRDLEFVLKNLDPGTTIEVFIVPMNEAGAGPASPTVTKVTGV